VCVTSHYRRHHSSRLLEGSSVNMSVRRLITEWLTELFCLTPPPWPCLWVMIWKVTCLWVMTWKVTVIDSFLRSTCLLSMSPSFILGTHKMAVDASSASWCGGMCSVGDIPRMTPVGDRNVLWNNHSGLFPRVCSNYWTKSVNLSRRIRVP